MVWATSNKEVECFYSFTGVRVNFWNVQLTFERKFCFLWCKKTPLFIFPHYSVHRVNLLKTDNPKAASV